MRDPDEKRLDDLLRHLFFEPREGFGMANDFHLYFGDKDGLCDWCDVHKAGMDVARRLGLDSDLIDAIVEGVAAESYGAAFRLLGELLGVDPFDLEELVEPLAFGNRHFPEAHIRLTPKEAVAKIDALRKASLRKTTPMHGVARSRSGAGPRAYPLRQLGRSRHAVRAADDGDGADL